MRGWRPLARLPPALLFSGRKDPLPIRRNMDMPARCDPQHRHRQVRFAALAKRAVRGRARCCRHRRSIPQTLAACRRFIDRRGRSPTALTGPARYLAHTYGCRVDGIDLTLELIETGRVLTERCKLADRVVLQVGNRERSES